MTAWEIKELFIPQVSLQHGAMIPFTAANGMATSDIQIEIFFGVQISYEICLTHNEEPIKALFLLPI